MAIYGHLHRLCYSVLIHNPQLSMWLCYLAIHLKSSSIHSFSLTVSLKYSNIYTLSYKASKLKNATLLLLDRFKLGRHLTK